MRRVLATRRHSVGFGLLIAFCLLLPVGLRLEGLPSRKVVYDGISHFAGAFVYLRQRIWEDKGDLDLAFVGNSLMRLAIDETLIQGEFRRRLGRDSRTVVLGLTWQGLDYQYYVMRDFLENRYSPVMVISMPNRQHRINRPHVQLYRLLRFGDYPDSLEGLSIYHQAALYSCFVLGAPRHLLSYVRPNIPTPFPRDALPPDIVDRRGYGFKGKPFVRDNADPPVFPAQRMLTSSARLGWFDVSGPPLGDYQLHYARKIMELAGQKHVTLVILHLPIYSEKGESKVMERMDWIGMSPSGQVLVAGVPPVEFFRGLTEEQYEHMYEDEHLSINGQRRFTSTVLPALWSIYESATRHR